MTVKRQRVAPSPSEQATAQDSNGRNGRPMLSLHSESAPDRLHKQHSYKTVAINRHSSVSTLAMPAIASGVLAIALIFGGCCSNVYTLEAIIKGEPNSGLTITFFQFILTTLLTCPQHISLGFNNGRLSFFTRRTIPFYRLLPIIFLFFAVNLLNNIALGSISVPVHIILRSGGSILTMLVGWLWGKKYNKTQVTSVLLMTAGICMAGWADAKAKGKASSPHETKIFGLFLLLLAQTLGAILGLYTEVTYKAYSPAYHENLFYSHFCGIPLFLPWYKDLRAQYTKLQDSAPMITFQDPRSWLNISSAVATSKYSKLLPFRLHNVPPIYNIIIPTQIANLGFNALTQFVCISGVNMLASKTSALSVSIVLILRKLVSLILSIYIFGNSLPAGVIWGAIVTFGSVGLYGWEGQRQKAGPTERKEGKAEKGEEGTKER